MAEQIIKSASAADSQAVEEYLESGVHVDVQDSEGVTPLQVAAANGFDKIAKLLLSKGATVDLPNEYGWTPLMLAARHGHTSTISLLLKHRAKVNFFNKLGITPVSAAVCSGQLSAVKVLMEAGAIADPTPLGILGPLESELTPIMVAAYLGYDSLLRIILEKGAPVNHVSIITGWSPLMLAAGSGHKQTVQSLVVWGADLNVADVCGRTALDIALIRGHPEVRAYLENVTALGSTSVLPKRKEMLETARSGNANLVRQILKDDPGSVHAVDPAEGMTALMLASMAGHLDVVRLLLLHNANINSQDIANGWTALMHSVFHRHTAVVKFLLEKGADTTIQANNGYTVIDLARYTDNADFEIMKLLAGKQEVRESVACSGAASAGRSASAEPRRKSLSFDIWRSPKSSPPSVRFKGMFKGVASHLHTLLPRKSGKVSDTCSPVGTPSPQKRSISDEVFESGGSSSSDTGGKPKAMLSLSALKSPNRYLADCLRKHSMEPVTPPLLTSSATDDLDLKKCKKSRKPKNAVVSLMTPHLLRSYSEEISMKILQNEGPSGYVWSTPLQGRKSRSNKAGSASLNVSHSLKRPSSCKSLRSDSSTEDATALRPRKVRENSSASSLVVRRKDVGNQDCVIASDTGLDDILRQQSLQRYAQKFKEQEVDSEAFQYFTEDDLKEIGIDTLTSRVKLMKVVEQLKRSRADESPS